MTESVTIQKLRRCASPECGCLFAVCRSCGWTRRYCSSSCRDETRRRRVREAGHRYQQSSGGRQAHAARQARYRQRQSVRSHVLLPSTPAPELANLRAVSDKGGRRPGDNGEVRCPKDRGPADRDLVSVPPVTHHPAGHASSSDGREEPSGRPIVRSSGMPTALGRRVSPLPWCAFCGRGHHRTFLIVQDGPPPHLARLGRRFRWRGATEPACSESRVL